MIILRILPWALWVALVVFSVATYGGLPADLPRHLDAAGNVTRSAPRGWFSWMLLPLIAGLTQAGLTAITLYLPRRPDLFNFPEKERFLKLPPRFRGEVIRYMQMTLDSTGVLTMGVMGFVQYMMWRTAMGEHVKNLSVVLIVCTIAFVPLLLIFTSRVNGVTEEAERKWKAAGSPTA